MSSAMNKESGRVQADLAFNFPGAPLSVFEGGVFSSILKCEHLSLRTRRHIPNLPNRFEVSSWRMNKRQFLQITRALVDSRRFDILERIASAQGEISCVSLRAKLPISRATLSHHLSLPRTFCHSLPQSPVDACGRPVFPAHNNQFGKPRSGAAPCPAGTHE